MPTYDYQCDLCNGIEEHFFRISEKPDILRCTNCGGAMQQKPGIGVIMGDEAAWLNSAAEVADRNGSVEARRFRSDPTRDNYRKWLKAENLRPLERGEETWKRPKATVDRKKIREEVKRNHQKRSAITL